MAIRASAPSTRFNPRAQRQRPQQQQQQRPQQQKRSERRDAALVTAVAESGSDATLCALRATGRPTSADVSVEGLDGRWVGCPVWGCMHSCGPQAGVGRHVRWLHRALKRSTASKEVAGRTSFLRVRGRHGRGRSRERIPTFRCEFGRATQIFRGVDNVVDNLFFTGISAEKLLCSAEQPFPCKGRHLPGLVLFTADGKNDAHHYSTPPFPPLAAATQWHDQNPSRYTHPPFQSLLLPAVQKPSNHHQPCPPPIQGASDGYLPTLNPCLPHLQGRSSESLSAPPPYRASLTASSLAGVLLAAGVLSAAPLSAELLLPPAAGASSGPTLQGQARVVDGDTLVVDGTRIRLFGVDAPESKQVCRDALGKVRCNGGAAMTRRRLRARAGLDERMHSCSAHFKGWREFARLVRR
eukprot:352766-Chlamydomonas_euryale.AAC.5